MDQFTNADRDRWFARYDDDYDTPEMADRAYVDYLAERDLARSITSECDLKSEGDLGHVLSPEHAQQSSGDDMTATSQEITCPTWCTRKHGANELEVGDVVHGHVAATSPLGDVSIDQSTLSDGQPVDWMPGILLPEIDTAEVITAASARRLATALSAAADILDSINAKDAA